MAGMIDSAGSYLIAIARAAIATGFGENLRRPATAPWLEQPGASFVTLRNQGKLRGCVGTLAPTRSLAEDVSANAHAAAFRDTRFAALSAREFVEIRIEVSVLSPLARIECCGEQDLLAQLRPGVDGLALEFGAYRATFLPQVWDELADARQFLKQLKLKAGLVAEFWSDDIAISRYRVSKWSEGDTPWPHRS